MLEHRFYLNKTCIGVCRLVRLRACHRDATLGLTCHLLNCRELRFEFPSGHAEEETTFESDSGHGLSLRQRSGPILCVIEFSDGTPIVFALVALCVATSKVIKTTTHKIHEPFVLLGNLPVGQHIAVIYAAVLLTCQGRCDGCSHR